MTTLNNLVSKVIPTALDSFSVEPLTRVDHENLPADNVVTSKIDSSLKL